MNGEVDMYLQMLRFWSEALKPASPPDWNLPNSVVHENASLKLRLFNRGDIAHKVPILLLSPNAGHHQKSKAHGERHRKRNKQGIGSTHEKHQDNGN